jgi:1,4-alpha-glucan branching enzyme
MEAAMSVKKQYFKTKPYCKVTFRLNKKVAQGAHRVAIAGEFNNWQTQDTLMKPLKNGDFTATIRLEPGREYQYRYVVDGRHWLTDSTADKVKHCDFANDKNSVVVV